MNTETTPRSDAPRKKKRWPMVLGGIVVLIVLLVVFAPALIATLGKGTVESTINGTIKGSVAIDSLSLSWLGGQTVTGLELRDPDGNVVATVDSVSTELSLLSAIRGDLNLGKTVVAGLNGDVKIDAEGRSNLQKAIEMVEPSPETDEPAAVPPSLAIDAQITGAKVKVTPHEGEPAELSDLEVVALIKSMSDPVTFTATGVTSQGGRSGKLTVNGSLANLFDSAGVVTVDKVDADVTADISDTPSMLIDGLVPVHGLIAEALGARIEHAKIKANGTLESQDVSVDIKADRLLVALAGKVADGRFTMISSETAKLQVTDGLLKSLAAMSEADSQLRLVKPAWVTLELKGLSVPLKTTDLATTAVNAVVTAEPIELTGDERIGDVAISNLRASFETEKLADAATFGVNADTQTNGQPGEIKINGEVRGLVDISGAPQPDKMSADAVASIKSVPAALLNRIAPIELAAAADGKPAQMFDFAWFGSKLNVDATVNTAAEGAKTIALKVNTDRMKADVPLAISDVVRTTEPASLTWNAPLAALQALGLGDMGIAFGEVTPIEVSDLTFAAPMPADATDGKPAPPAFQPDKTKLAGSIKIGDLIYRVDDANTLSLSRIEAKIAGDSLVNMTLEATTSIVVPESSVDLRSQLGSRIDADLEGTIKTSDLANFDPAKVDAVIEATLDTESGQLRELFGGKATIKLTKTPATTDNFSLAVDSDRVKANVPGTLTLGDNAALTTKTSTLNATVTPKLSASLKEPTTASLEIAPTTIPLSGFSLAKLKTQVTGGFDRIVLAAAGAADGTVLTGLKFTEPLVFDGPAQTLVAKLNGRALAPGQTGEGSPIDVSANLAKIFDADGALAIATSKIDAKAIVKDLPTAVVDAFAEQGGKLTPILGPTVNLDATVATTGGSNSNGTANIAVRSANLTANADLKLTDGVVSLVDGKPATIEWTMTPAAFAVLTSPIPTTEDLPAPPTAAPTSTGKDGKVQGVATLNEPTKITLTADKLSAKLPGEGEAFDLTQVAMSAKLKSQAIKMTDNKTGKAVTIDGLDGSVTSSRLADGIKIASHSTVATAGVPTPGKLDIDANLSDLFGPDGGFNSAAYNAGIKARLVEIPGSLAEALFGSGSNKVAALIGESGTIEADVDLKSGQGPAKITIDSQNTKLLFDGRIENNVLKLNQDLTASIMATEELTDIEVGGSVVDVLAKLLFGNPLLKQAVKSIEPVKLHIAAKGFEAPLEDFSIEKVKIAQATLNPGKLIVENAGLINLLVTLPSNIRGLKPTQLIKDLSASNDIEAWFTDMPFSLESGVARLGRMDMLLGKNYQVAIWGTINLSDKETAAGNEMIGPQSGRVVLGLAERAMRRVYGISAFKDDPDYVDQFVMKGPLETLGPNQTEMIGRIGLLTGLGAAGVGNQGIGILKTIGEGGRILSGKDKSPPPPTAPVAPWPSEEEQKAADEAAKDAGKEPAATPTTDPDAPAAATDEPKPAPKDEPEPAPTRSKPKSDKEKLEDLGKDLLRDLIK